MSAEPLTERPFLRLLTVDCLGLHKPHKSHITNNSAPAAKTSNVLRKNKEAETSLCGEEKELVL